jgi:hypothetical protein
MDKNLKIIAMFFVVAFIAFSAGCIGNSQNTQNPAQGTPEQKTNQPPANDNMMPHHRLHTNGSERPYWNNTSGRPHFNGSERPYWNNTSERPHFNGSERPYWNNTSGKPYWNGSGNVTEQTFT